MLYASQCQNLSNTQRAMPNGFTPITYGIFTLGDKNLTGPGWQSQANAAASRAVGPLGRQGSNPCPGAIRTFNEVVHNIYRAAVAQRWSDRLVTRQESDRSWVQSPPAAPLFLFPVISEQKKTISSFLFTISQKSKCARPARKSRLALHPELAAEQPIEILE